MKRSNPDYIKMLIEKANERREWRVSTYTGDYVEIPMSDEEYKSFKKSVFLLIILNGILYFGAGFLNNPGMFEVFVVFPYVTAFFSYVYFCINLFQFPKEKDKFRLGEAGLLFNRLKMANIFLGVSLSACILGEIFFISKTSIENPLNFDFIFIAMMVLVIILVLLLAGILKRIVNKINVD